MQDILEGNDFTPIAVFFFIFSAFQGVLIRIFLNTFKISIPDVVILLILGVVWGFIARESSFVERHILVLSEHRRMLSNLAIPVLIFHRAMTLDYHSMMRSFGQVFIIACPVFLIRSILVGIIMKFFLNFDCTYPQAVVVGMFMCIVFPANVVDRLKSVGTKTKHLVTLMEAESVLTVGCFNLYRTICQLFAQKITDDFTFTNILIGLLVAVIAAVLLYYMVNFVGNDPHMIIALTVVASITTYLINVIVKTAVATMSVLIIGLVIGKLRVSLSIEVENHLVHFWNSFSYFVLCFHVMAIGVHMSFIVFRVVEVVDFSFAIVLFVLIAVIRFISFLIFYFVLSRIECGISFTNLCIVVFCAPSHPLAICFYGARLRTTDGMYFFICVLFYTTSQLFLSFLFNNYITTILLKINSMNKISLGGQMNMNSCLRHIESKRSTTIAILKMDRFLSDANWPLIMKKTSLYSPYRNNSFGNYFNEDEVHHFEKGRSVCPECSAEITKELSTVELHEMHREARRRILKAKRSSYFKQYENKTLSKASLLLLDRSLEVAIDSNSTGGTVNCIKMMFHKEGFLARVRRRMFTDMFGPPEVIFKPPKLYWRRKVYNTVITIDFELLMILTVVVSNLEFLLNYASHYIPKYNLYITLLYIITTLALIIELLLKLIAFHCYYFTSVYNVIDFGVLMGIIAFAHHHLCISLICTSADYFNIWGYYIIKIVQVTRLLHLVRTIRPIYSYLISYCDTRFDSNLATALDMSIGFLNGQNQVLEVLTYMIPNKAIRDNLKTILVYNKREVIRMLGALQKSKPWITVTVKTKHAINDILSSMRYDIQQLKKSGWIDEMEYKNLLAYLEKRVSYAHNITLVQPCSPKLLFTEILWLGRERKINEFLYEHVLVKLFKPGESVMKEGEKCDGIYMVLTGFLKLTYVPNKHVLKQKSRYGILPVTDIITTYSFENVKEDYLLVGNCIGEIGILTDRNYNCNIVADTPAELLYLPRDIIKDAIRKSKDPLNGLERRMWKFICLNLFVSILMEVPVYQSLIIDKIKIVLYRAFIPKISAYKKFVVHEDIEDILLIEGILADLETREVYIGPCYIPRTIQTLVLPQVSHSDFDSNVETKILIIPIKNIDQYDLMLKVEEISELNPDYVSEVKAHVLKHKKKQKVIVDVGQRRTRYKRISKDSVHSNEASSVNPPSSRTSS